MASGLSFLWLYSSPLRSFPGSNFPGQGGLSVSGDAPGQIFSPGIFSAREALSVFIHPPRRILLRQNLSQQKSHLPLSIPLSLFLGSDFAEPGSFSASNDAPRTT